MPGIDEEYNLKLKKFIISGQTPGRGKKGIHHAGKHA
jgi:hypothetical protein